MGKRTEEPAEPGISDFQSHIDPVCYCYLKPSGMISPSCSQNSENLLKEKNFTEERDSHSPEHQLLGCLGDSYIRSLAGTSCAEAGH